MKVAELIQVVLSILISVLILLGLNYFKENAALKRIETDKQNEIIQREKDRIIYLDSFKNELQHRDKMTDVNIKNIYNNYEKIYNQVNDTSFNDFFPIIDSLLKRHDQIKFERNY